MLEYSSDDSESGFKTPPEVVTNQTNFSVPNVSLLLKRLENDELLGVKDQVGSYYENKDDDTSLVCENVSSSLSQQRSRPPHISTYDVIGNGEDLFDKMNSFLVEENSYSDVGTDKSIHEVDKKPYQEQIQLDTENRSSVNPNVRSERLIDQEDQKRTNKELIPPPQSIATLQPRPDVKCEVFVQSHFLAEDETPDQPYTKQEDKHVPVPPVRKSTLEDNNSSDENGALLDMQNIKSNGVLLQSYLDEEIDPLLNPYSNLQNEELVQQVNFEDKVLSIHPYTKDDNILLHCNKENDRASLSCGEDDEEKIPTLVTAMNDLLSQEISVNEDETPVQQHLIKENAPDQILSEDEPLEPVQHQVKKNRTQVQCYKTDSTCITAAELSSIMKIDENVSSIQPYLTEENILSVQPHALLETEACVRRPFCSETEVSVQMQPLITEDNKLPDSDYAKDEKEIPSQPYPNIIAHQPWSEKNNETVIQPTANNLPINQHLVHVPTADNLPINQHHVHVQVGNSGPALAFHINESEITLQPHTMEQNNVPFSYCPEEKSGGLFCEEMSPRYCNVCNHHQIEDSPKEEGLKITRRLVLLDKGVNTFDQVVAVTDKCIQATVSYENTSINTDLSIDDLHQAVTLGKKLKATSESYQKVLKEFNEEKSQRMVNDELIKILQADVTSLQERNVLVSTNRLKLENEMADLRAEYLHSQKQLEEKQTRVIELEESLSGTMMLVRQLEEQSAVLVNKGGIDYLLQAKIADGRAREAEEKLEILQAELLHSQAEIKRLLTRMSELSRERQEMVSGTVHFQLLKLSDERAQQAEMKVKELEQEVSRLKCGMEVSSHDRNSVPAFTFEPLSFQTNVPQSIASSNWKHGDLTATSSIGGKRNEFSLCADTSYTTQSAFDKHDVSNGVSYCSDNFTYDKNEDFSYHDISSISQDGAIIPSLPLPPISTDNYSPGDEKEKDESDSSDEWSSSSEGDIEEDFSLLRPSAHMNLKSKFEWLSSQQVESASQKASLPFLMLADEHKILPRKIPPPIAPKPKAFQKISSKEIIQSEGPVSFHEATKAPVLKFITRPKGPIGRRLPSVYQTDTSH